MRYSPETRKHHADLLSRLKPGDSFFIDGVRPGSLQYVRTLGYRLGMKLSIRFVLEDPIYGTMGCRVKLVGYRDKENARVES